MARYVVTAPHDVELAETLDGPLVYLAGPIQGAPNWQREAVDLLGAAAPDLHVACPRAVNFRGGPDLHLIWERAYAERAARDGVILCWLPRETAHRCSRSYAAQTRFELGEWAVRAQRGEVRLVIGIERGFTGGPHLARRFGLDYPQVPRCRSLRQACAAAAELAVGQPSAQPVLADLFVPQIGVRIQ
jgi:hypothetical protein